jgi:hypothetical protein
MWRSYPLVSGAVSPTLELLRRRKKRAEATACLAFLAATLFGGALVLLRPGTATSLALRHNVEDPVSTGSLAEPNLAADMDAGLRPALD